MLERRGSSMSQLPTARTMSRHRGGQGPSSPLAEFAPLQNGLQGALAAFNAVQPISLAGPGNAAPPAACSYSCKEAKSVRCLRGEGYGRTRAYRASCGYFEVFTGICAPSDS